MQDFLATYGLWLLIALAVIAVLLLLLKGKGQESGNVIAAPPPETAPVEPVAPPPPAPEPVAKTPVPTPMPGEPDNLLQLKGVGPKVNTILIGLGVTRFEQVAAWTDADIAKVDAHLGKFAGRAVRDQWMDQADYLARGDIAGFEAKYGKL